ncbi:MAG TPA: SdiA-regulated domain-containing protein [Puia sp.]|nr:SdiA-regulated domain-containing protein [Puia sp.]
MRQFFTRTCLYLFYYLFFPAASGCQPVIYQSPAAYDLAKPQRFVLKEPLHEISGITFLHGNADTVYAIEDEDGKLFSFHLGDAEYRHTKFGKKGDYEDVTILDDKEFVVLRSDGSLFTFPVLNAREKKIDNANEYPNILPPGEYEGLFADDDGRLIAMCKNCPDDKHKEVSIFALRKNAAGRLSITDRFKVNVSGQALTSEKKKVRFHPSGLSKNPVTHQWYILSSVNKALIVLDNQWKIIGFYELDPAVFRQPEGIAFDAKGNMYISNEGAEGSANILVFNYKTPKHL